MSPFFFQKNSDTVGSDVCLVVKHVLEIGHIEQDANPTPLTLIPKVNDVKEAQQLRPIALCNVLFRISSKVIANRLKSLLIDIISPLKSAYVLGRLISDNTLVAMEASHFMHKLKSQEEGFFL